MTDKEKILAEIERLKAEAFNNGKNRRSLVTDVANSQRIAICEQLLHFINSIPAEQPSEELEREIKLYQLRNPVINHQEKSLNGLIKRVAIYFTQWQKEKLLNKACEWLKENIYNRIYKCNDGLSFPTAAFLEEFKKAMEDK